MTHPLILTAHDFVDLSDYVDRHPLRVDLVYAQPAHADNMFKCAIYRDGARMWAWKPLAEMTAKAADILHARTGWILEAKDCLRTVDAQAAIAQTPICLANPQWFAEPLRLFSPPGKGGHPRGMAIDVIARAPDGSEIDMGTPFDFLPTDGAGPDVNPSHREYQGHSDSVMANRAQLTSVMMDAAAALSLPLRPLPQEWWDFRMVNEFADQYAPMRDADLPAHMRMTHVSD